MNDMVGGGGRENVIVIDDEFFDVVCSVNFCD